MNARTLAAQRMALRAIVPRVHLEAGNYEAPGLEGVAPNEADLMIGAQLRRLANLMDAIATRGSDSAIAKFFGDGPV